MSGEMKFDGAETGVLVSPKQEAGSEDIEVNKEAELREIIEEVRADVMNDRGQLFINKNLLTFVDDLNRFGISKTDIERTKLYKILLNQEEPNGQDPLDIPGNHLEAFVHTLGVHK